MGNSDSFGAAFGRLMKRKRAEMRITQGGLAALIYPNDENAAEARKGDISKLENGKVANPNTTTISKISKALEIPAEQIDALQKQAQMSPAEQLNILDTLPRNTLELLASRFEIEAPHALSDYDLQSVLTKKAEEYRNYRTLIDGLDVRVAAIANLKGAAQDAAERLDFEAVEELLSRVDTVETEIAADTKQARAANALLRGRTQQAYDILTAAADSFASVDPLEPSRRRHTYGEMLYDYGLRFAGDALELAAQMWGKAAEDVDRAQNAELWADLQNNLGNALTILGRREIGTTQLKQAIQAYQNALTEWTQERVPLRWAMTQNNLGGAFKALGERESDTMWLNLAVASCNNALTERTQDKVPQDWAMTQNNLGNALQTLGERESGTTSLKQALAAFHNALSELTQDKVPLDWAGTQNNLGNVLQILGERENSNSLLEQAIEAYQNALTEWTQESVPLDWATIQVNLGTACRKLGQRENDTTRLDQAVQAYEKALCEWTRDRVPLDWAMTQGNLGGAYQAYFDKTDDPAHLETAEAHVQAALAVFEQSAPHYAGMAQELLQQIAERRGRC